MAKVSDVGDVVKKNFICGCGFMGETTDGTCVCGSKKIEIIDPLIGEPTKMSGEMCTENPYRKDSSYNYE